MSNTGQPEQPSDFAQIRDYLYSLKNRGSKYGIERMRRFAEALGHPQHRFRSIHVAGTNGKGSVCAMLEALYRQNGYRTGLYTSPHLVHLGERVQVNREPLKDTAIMQRTAQLKQSADAISQNDPDDYPSFFEFMTATAFLEFAEAEVEIALIETGLGGRLDATNVLDPELSIITSIGLDHTELLGDSLAQIASEKGGIIKAGKPVLIGKLPAEAEAVIREIAEERASKIYSVSERFADFESLPETNLAGSFQRWNAGLALYATEILAGRFPIQDATPLQRIQWAGRWQMLELSDRRLILDATHNAEGAQMLDENLARLRVETGTKPVIIAGTLGDERGRSLMEIVAKHASKVHLLAPKQDRALSTEALRRHLPSFFEDPIHQNQIEELFPKTDTCTAGSPGETIIVTGSLYLIGEVLQQLQGTPELSDLQDKI